MDEKLQEIEELVTRFGQISGDHHKTWIIDQVMRIIKNNQYDEFVKKYENNGEYEWDIGIAP